MVPGSRMPMHRDDDAKNADQAAAAPVDESLDPTNTGEDLDAKADTTEADAPAEADATAPGA